MQEEFSGIERRLQRLDESLQRLEALSGLAQDDFLGDADLRDIVERNLEVAAQCCIDIAHRIVSLEGAPGPRDAHESLLRLGEVGVLDPAFAREFSPVAGFRNVLAHEYLSIDWNLVYAHLQELESMHRYAAAIRNWLSEKGAGPART